MKTSTEKEQQLVIVLGDSLVGGTAAPSAGHALFSGKFASSLGPESAMSTDN